MEEIINDGYGELLGEIKTRIRSAQYEALRAVNKELINLYWNIGELIVEKQQGETWGLSVVKQLATDIRNEFPGIQGFSSPNLWRMKQFYEADADSQKLSPLVREIGWTHNTIILMNCKDDLEREFYIRMTDELRPNSACPDALAACAGDQSPCGTKCRRQQAYLRLQCRRHFH